MTIDGKESQVDISYLFTGIGRQVEHQNRHESQADTWNNQIYSVEQRFSPHLYVESNI